MLWYCSFTWHPSTTTRDVRKRILQQDEHGTNIPNKIKGWYDLAGGGAGFVLIETDNIEEVNAFCQPYMDLMNWDVRAVRALDYRSSLERFRRES